MNQIPYEGEFCLDCPCKDVAWKSCALYEEKVSLDRYAPLRLPICISERPKIVKGGEGEVMESELDMVIWLNNHEATERDKKEMNTILKDLRDAIKVCDYALDQERKNTAYDKANKDFQELLITANKERADLEARLKEAERLLQKCIYQHIPKNIPLYHIIEEALKGLGKENNDQRASTKDLPA